jgi:hypothetical protein
MPAFGYLTREKAFSTATRSGCSDRINIVISVWIWNNLFEICSPAGVLVEPFSARLSGVAAFDCAETGGSQTGSMPSILVPDFCASSDEVIFSRRFSDLPPSGDYGRGYVGLLIRAVLSDGTMKGNGLRSEFSPFSPVRAMVVNLSLAASIC